MIDNDWCMTGHTDQNKDIMVISLAVDIMQKSWPYFTTDARYRRCIQRCIHIKDVTFLEING